ncbi:hypothetical protein [Qipengyuania nanhaisediminis]|nr:hypothetical protein [Qipengyuania nanhaisediminis]
MRDFDPADEITKSLSANGYRIGALLEKIDSSYSRASAFCSYVEGNMEGYRNNLNSLQLKRESIVRDIDTSLSDLYLEADHAFSKQNADDLSQNRFSFFGKAEKSIENVRDRLTQLKERADDLSIELLHEHQWELEDLFQRYSIADFYRSIPASSIQSELESIAECHSGYSDDEIEQKKKSYLILGGVAGLILAIFTYPLAMWSFGNIADNGGIFSVLILLAILGGATILLGVNESGWVLAAGGLFALALFFYLLPLLIIGASAGLAWYLFDQQMEKNASLQSHHRRQMGSAAEKIGKRILDDCRGTQLRIGSELMAEIEKESAILENLIEQLASLEADFSARLAKAQRIRKLAIG